MFDTGLLRSFVAVAESGRFTKAAKLLNCTQSTVSAQIQRLEDEAGSLLFVRSTRSVQLTSAGETLLGYARTILRVNEDARLRLSGVRHAGIVPVGVNEDLTDSWLPEVLHRFGRQYPEVEVELEIGIGPSLFEMVETQELDLAVGGLCNGRSRAGDRGASRWCGHFRQALRSQVCCRSHFPGAMSIPRSGASRAGRQPKAVAHRLHKLQFGRDSGGCYSRAGPYAVTATKDRARPPDSWQERQNAETSGD